MRQIIWFAVFILIIVSILFLSSCSYQSSDRNSSVGEQLVHGYVKMWNSRDLSMVDEIFTDGCVFEDVAALEKYSGIDELKASLKEDFAWCSDLKMELTSSLVTEDGAAIEWIWSGRQTGDIEGLIDSTGKVFSIRGNSIMEFENGKIKRNSDYYDAGGFLYQLGVKFVFPSDKVVNRSL
jgi:steroid delta-isomerase-like uncharacterized protein